MSSIEEIEKKQIFLLCDTIEIALYILQTREIILFGFIRICIEILSYLEGILAARICQEIPCVSMIDTIFCETSRDLESRTIITEMRNPGIPWLRSSRSETYMCYFKSFIRTIVTCRFPTSDRSKARLWETSEIICLSSISRRTKESSSINILLRPVTQSEIKWRNTSVDNGIDSSIPFYKRNRGSKIKFLYRTTFCTTHRDHFM